MSKPQNGRGRYVVKHLWNRPDGLADRMRRELVAKGQAKPGGTRDKRFARNRPKTGAGSRGGAVPRRRPRRK